jgi:predicted MFS family arabinose efflux permease
MTGIALSGIGFGTLLFSPAANHLIFIYDWCTSYSILGLTLLVVILFAAQFLRRDPERMGQLPYGHYEPPKDLFQGEKKMYFLKEALFKWQFWTVFGMFFCFGFCFSAVIVHIAPHATDMGKSTYIAAGLISSIGIASVAGKILLGVLSDKTGNKTIYMICFSMMATSTLCLTPAKETWLLYLFALVFGLAYGGNATSQSPLVATLFGLQSHGIILGTVNNGFTIGATLGPVVSGSLFDLFRDYRAAFLFISFVAISGLVLTLFLRPKKFLHLS